MNYSVQRLTQTIKDRIAVAANIGFGLRLAWSSHRALTVVNLLLLALISLPPLITLYLTKLVLDAVAASLSDTAALSLTDILPLIVLAGAAALAEVVLRALSQLVSQHHGEVITDHLHDTLHAQAATVDLAYYENPHYFDTLYMAQRQAISRPTSILMRLLSVGRSGLTLALMAGLLFALYWWLALALFVAALPGVLVKLYYARRLYEWQQTRTTTERRSLYYNILLTAFEFAKEIRLFQIGPLVADRFKALRLRLRAEKFRIESRRAAAEIIAQSSGVVAMFALYAFVVDQALRGQITVGDLVLYYQGFRLAQGHLQTLLGSFAALYEDGLFLSRIRAILQLQPSVAPPEQPAPLPQRLQTGLTFEGVAFRYPHGARTILTDVSLRIHPGEIVAFVGENGAGKTTLIKLLCRLYDPTSGSIRLDSVDLRDFDPVALRREITVIFQDYAHYSLTARDNIWFGNIWLDPHDSRIEDAARAAGIHDKLAALPNGYDTLLGTTFAGGVELSIGEWQKVALARAFLSDAQIIVLDEPTSSMDARAEYELFERFRQVIHGRTAILISHRLSTVRMADRIFVLDGGRVVESGTHTELMQRSGKYANLYDMQASSYQA